MSRKELNEEIQKRISNLTDDGLRSVLDYLNKVDNSNITLSKNLNKILEEDEELLKKLAQ